MIFRADCFLEIKGGTHDENGDLGEALVDIAPWTHRFVSALSPLSINAARKLVRGGVVILRVTWYRANMHSL